MAKSLRSKRKRKFRALKRIKHQPKIDAKMKEIAITMVANDEKMAEKQESKELCSQVDSEGKIDSIANDNAPEIENSGDDDDIDMEGNRNIKQKSGKNAVVPYHLLSQRKLRKLQIKQKQKKVNKKKKFLKW